MEKIKIGLIDLFGYVVPGLFVLAIAYCLLRMDNGTSLAADWVVILHIGWDSLVLIVVAAYLVGFLTGIVGDMAMEGLKKIYVIPKDDDLDTTSKYCLVREMSPENFKVIEQFDVVKKMSSNLGVIAIAGGIILCLNAKDFNFGYLVLGIVTGILFFLSSCKYYKRRIKTLDNVVTAFDLTTKARKCSNKYKDCVAGSDGA